MNDDLFSLLDGADPETLNLMMRALGAPEKMGVGHEMFGAQAPQGRTVGPYGAYVASSPLEHLSHGAERVIGANLMGGARSDRSAGIQAYINALRSRGAPQAPTPELPQEMARD